MNNKNNLLKKISIVLITVFIASYANAQKLENAFNAISKIEGFQMMDYTAEEYGYPKEIGNMKMTCYGNSDPRDKVLEILSKIPSELIVLDDVNERGKIYRWYKEDLDNGETKMMFVFVGWGGNDLAAQIFSGSSRSYYEQFSNKIVDEYNKAKAQ